VVAVAIRVVVERSAGLDIAKASLIACVQVPAGGGGYRVCKARFGTTTRELAGLADWLTDLGVTRVGMESTSDYWKPVFYTLESRLECWLLNARHVKSVPGRKTDATDAEWICDLTAYALVHPSFVPPPPIRRLRDLTRRRAALLADRTREKQRCEKLLEDAGVKLSVVASDVFGVSGRDMLAALIAGQRDPGALAELARGRMRSKKTELADALVGRFDDHHAFCCRQILDHIDTINAQLAALDARITAETAPYGDTIELLRTIPGVDRRVAEVIVAETGADMSRFPTAAHLASWAGLCPGNNKTGGKARPGRLKPGNRWLKAGLGAAALACARQKHTYLGAQYRRIAGRGGKHAGKRATAAVAHSILTAVWHMLTTQTPYHDLGADHFTNRTNPQRQVRRMLTRLNKLGYRVTLDPIEAA
jgi:transposase